MSNESLANAYLLLENSIYHDHENLELAKLKVECLDFNNIRLTPTELKITTFQIIHPPIKSLNISQNLKEVPISDIIFQI